MATITKWARQAAPGEIHCYWLGNLAADRDALAARLMAWRLYELGIVTLVQKKIVGSRGFAYLAVKLKGKGKWQVSPKYQKA